jgi:hypothetical protein
MERREKASARQTGRARRLVRGQNHRTDSSSVRAMTVPCQKNKYRDQESNNDHPNLAFHPKKAKLLNKQFHRFRPTVVQTQRSGTRNILFLYE